MKVMVVHPGHSHSTADVFTGLVAGLEANGVEVVPYRLDNALHVTEGLHKLAEEHAPPLAAAFNPIAVAAHAITGQAIWRDVQCVVAVTGQNFYGGAVATLKKIGKLTVLLCTESPYLTEERERHDAQVYDVVFTNDKSAVGLFDHPHVAYLPAAYNAAVHRVDGPIAPASPDVFFVGTAFDERRALMDAVQWEGITLKIAGTGWGVNIGLMDNAESAAYYRSAAISLNYHRTTRDYGSGRHITEAYSLGPRAYEIAACGGFQLMDDSRPEARAVFGTSLATYRAGDAADLERQIRFWLAHPDERTRMAAAQHAAVQAHSWQNRAATLLDTLTGAAEEHPTWQPSTA